MKRPIQQKESLEEEGKTRKENRKKSQEGRGTRGEKENRTPREEKEERRENDREEKELQWGRSYSTDELYVHCLFS